MINSKEYVETLKLGKRLPLLWKDAMSENGSLNFSVNTNVKYGTSLP
jgi:hypothetical protein